MPKSSRTSAIPASVIRKKITRLVINCATSDRDEVLMWLKSNDFEITADNPRRVSFTKIDAKNHRIVAEKVTNEKHYDYL